MVNGQVERVELNEISRVYIFPNNQELTINNAVECFINQKNTHLLITKEGEVYNIPYKWIAMKYVPIVKDKESKK